MSTASHAWSLPASCARVSAARRRSARASAERSTPGSGHSDAERSVPSSARAFSRRAMASVALSLVLLGTCAVPLVAASSEGDESKVLMDAIRAHRVVIVSKSYCPYSRAVKKLFNEQYPEVYPHVIEIDQARGLNMASFQSMLMETYGHRTVPQVFAGARRRNPRAAARRRERLRQLPFELRRGRIGGGARAEAGRAGHRGDGERHRPDERRRRRRAREDTGGDRRVGSRGQNGTGGRRGRMGRTDGSRPDGRRRRDPVLIPTLTCTCNVKRTARRFVTSVL